MVKSGCELFSVAEITGQVAGFQEWTRVRAGRSGSLQYERARGGFNKVGKVFPKLRIFGVPQGMGENDCELPTKLRCVSRSGSPHFVP